MLTINQKQAITAFLTLVLCTTGTLGAVNFSLDIPSPTGAPPDDLLAPGPVPVLTGIGAEINGFSYGHGPGVATDFFFSVDGASGGFAGSVLIEAGAADQAADIYVTTLPGGATTNALVFDGDGSSGPALGLMEVGSSDNIDGLDMRAGPVGPFVYWTVDPFTLTGAPYSIIPGASSADIWFGPPGPGYSGAPTLFAGAVALGLVTADDIDALAVVDVGGPGGIPDAVWGPGDAIFYSLALGSPSLGAGSPADVFLLPFGGSLTTIPAAAFGLLTTDNITALDITVVPEPSTYLMLGSSLMLVAVRSRQKSFR